MIRMGTGCRCRQWMGGHWVFLLFLLVVVGVLLLYRILEGMEEHRSANDLGTEEWGGWTCWCFRCCREATGILICGYRHEVKVRSCASVERYFVLILASTRAWHRDILFLCMGQASNRQ